MHDIVINTLHNSKMSKKHARTPKPRHNLRQVRWALGIHAVRAIYRRNNFAKIILQQKSSRVYGAIHTSELDRSEINLSAKRSECERSNAN